MLLLDTFSIGFAGAVILTFVFLFTIIAGFTGPVAGLLMRVAILRAILDGGQGSPEENGERGPIADTVLGIGIIAMMVTVTVLFPPELVASSILAVCALAFVKKRR